jgi:hypothetical protein
MKYLYNAIIFILFSANTQAGNDNIPIGARAAGLSNSAVTFSDVWSAHHNQAGLGFLKSASAGAYYESRFLLPELSMSGAVAALPLNNQKGTFGLSFRNFGYSLYSESKIGLAFGKAFGDNLSIGMQLNYQQVRIADVYGNKSVITAEVGMQYRISSKLFIGAHIYNPNRSKLTNLDQDRLPSVIRFGARYQFSEQLLLAVETEKDTYNPAIFRAGIEYLTGSVLFLRAGMGTNPFASSFGFGLKLKKLKIDFSGSFHRTLGFTPQTSLTYQFGS